MTFSKNYNPANANDNTTVQRRRFPRRSHDVCMVNVDGNPYPVVDWSLSGLLFEGDSRLFETGQNVNMILRFKLNNKIEDVKVTAGVVRKNTQSIATHFTELPSKTQQTLHRLIDELPAETTKSVVS